MSFAPFHRLGLLVGIALVLLGSSGDPPARTLRLASDAWPPFTDTPPRPRFAIELVEKALERSGVAARTSIVQGRFDEVLKVIREKEFDGSAALWRAPNREELLLYSRPYLENRLVLVARKGTNVDAGALAELSGSRIGVVSGYAYGDALASVARSDLVPGRSDGANLQDLLRGRVDYVLIEELVLHRIVEREAETRRQLAIASEPISKRTLHLGLRRDLPGATGIIERFDAEIGAMLVDGTYNRILDLDWVWADVNGDGQSELILRGTRAGRSAPSAGYDVISADTPEPPPPDERPYVIEGSVYADWDAVPERYKVPITGQSGPDDPSPVAPDY